MLYKVSPMQKHYEANLTLLFLRFCDLEHLSKISLSVEAPYEI